MNQFNRIPRRLWLASPLAVIAKASAQTISVHRRDHVLGTSLELQVLGSRGDLALEACLNEIERLRRILSTFDETSEISQWQGRGETGPASGELLELLNLYEHWRHHTGGVIDSRLRGVRDVSALGKSFILEKAIEASCVADPEATGLLLNIGGDIAVRGGAWRIAVANPAQHTENSAAMAELHLTTGAVTTSGTYERGPKHLLDPRTGQPAQGAWSATVSARDAVTANALSTALCVLDPENAMRLIESTPEAECIVVGRQGKTWRSSGFSKLESRLPLRTVAAAGWPNGRQLTITLTLRRIEGYRVRRPYVAVWAEDLAGKVVKNITVWTERRRWLPDLFDWWKKSGNAGGGASVTRATRPAGRYQILWDGLDDAGKPVPEGKYRIVVESNREHGSYAKESAVIECGANPAKAMMRETNEFEAVELNYGPGGQAA